VSTSQSQRRMFATTATVNPNTNTSAMYYLIHTPNHPRPYLSTVSFIANDFATWGCRVTRHAKNSPYITEVRYQEKKNRPASRRIELMEVWAKEVLSRKRDQDVSQLPSTAPSLEARKDRASGFVQDFISTLSTFGMYIRISHVTKNFFTNSTCRVPRCSTHFPSQRPFTTTCLPVCHGRKVHSSTPSVCIHDLCASPPMEQSRSPCRRSS
jgi:hypothetical protein